MSYEIRPAGDRGSLIEVPDNATAVRLARQLRAERPDLVDIVVGHTTVLVTWAAEPADLGELVLMPEPEPAGRRVEIPVAYDGPDLEEVARLTGLSQEEVVARHTGAEHVAAFLGFQPGFAYLIGGDELLRVPRREEPRTQVPGGTVAIAGPYSGVYPRDSPGGWRLLGSTATAMFDPAREPPALLAPGDRVRFVAA
ncbi:MAG TPA: 5-oxoprolinase subunit PxpB [Gaiellaceae bacterium]|nr:5-oxoprolinase subunit PxpB [Gaiellaceae bacterium]